MTRIASKVFCAAVLIFHLGPIVSFSSTSLDSDRSQQLLDGGWQWYRQGAFEAAGNAWKEAARVYADRDEPAQQTEAVTYLAYAYESLGQYRKALQQLEIALALAQRTNSENRMPVILGRMARNYFLLGQLDAAQKFFVEAIERARTLNDQAALAGLLTDYGNWLMTNQQNVEAVRAYKESADLAKKVNNPDLVSTALVNQARAMAEQEQEPSRKVLLDEALSYANAMPPTHEKAYTLITIGLAYDELSPSKKDTHVPSIAKSILAEAAALGQSLKDARAESYALGHLGALAEAEGRDQEALELSRKAVKASQRVDAPELLYRWHWQTGRILKRLGETDGAIVAYRRAVTLLQSIRPEMAAAYSTGRTSFRESVGPVYYELADLILQQSTKSKDRQQTEGLLVEARDTMELLKAAELRDYFRDECVDAAREHITRLDDVSSTAAAIYPILLPDRTDLLVSLPGGMKHITVQVSAKAMTDEIRILRRLLEKRTTREYLPHAQQLYDWIIRPLEKELEAAHIDTLVFVPDGALRTIPMAALHDGKKFIIAKYAVAISPGLDLTDPRPLKRETIKMLGAGITESVQGYPELPNVAGELDSIQKLYGGESMVNKGFQISHFAQELKNKELSVVHIASHGEFKKVAEESFILAYDDKLTMDRLNAYIGLFRFREEPLELLTLSACETAAGDDRAALGLAGIAIKAGARSALATLWSINDEASSNLIIDFYRELQKPGTSKAAALQRAQLKLMSDGRYQHPCYWSPFLLLNNWL